MPLYNLCSQCRKGMFCIYKFLPRGSPSSQCRLGIDNCGYISSTLDCAQKKTSSCWLCSAVGINKKRKFIVEQCFFQLVLNTRNFGTPEHWNTGTPEHSGTPEHRNTGTLRNTRKAWSTEFDSVVLFFHYRPWKNKMPMQFVYSHNTHEIRSRR